MSIDVASPVREAGSPLRKRGEEVTKGTNVGLVFDYDGNSILNTPDIGVYEYSGECPQIIVNFIIL